MGLGSLLFLGALGVSAAKEKLYDMECMSKPAYTTKNGVVVYTDGKCREHINGEQVYRKTVIDAYGNHHIQKIGVNSGRVYHDSYDEELMEAKKGDERFLNHAKQLAQDYGDGEVYHYYKYHQCLGGRADTEVATGLPYKLGSKPIRDDRWNHLIDTKYYIGYYNAKNPIRKDCFYGVKEITYLQYQRLGGKDHESPCLCSHEYVSCVELIRKQLAEKEQKEKEEQKAKEEQGINEE